jgi:uncharacterized protein (UPF0147 family)
MNKFTITAHRNYQPKTITIITIIINTINEVIESKQVNESIEFSARPPQLYPVTAISALHDNSNDSNVFCDARRL